MKLSAYPTSINKPRIVKIKEARAETATIKIFTFHDKACSGAFPGQFLMVWILGVDEIPMSLSMADPNGLSAITVRKVGEASEALYNLKKGDVIGVRGPYGRGFTLASGNLLMVGGGTGMACLMLLAEKLAKPENKVTCIIGAKTSSELLFLDRMGRILSEVIATTDDGTYGLKGLATDAMEQELARQKFDMVYTCGPEQMMFKAFQLAEQFNTPLQASLERIMRCSIGLCGSCMIGEFRVCIDGPVLTSEELRKVKEEFGAYKRDFTGRKIKI
jgi:dihydroorotate dehydrogenase electron transfer subunit